MGTNEMKRLFKAIPRELVHTEIEVGGMKPMPEFFLIDADHYYVSSRFREVVERFDKASVE